MELRDALEGFRLADAEKSWNLDPDAYQDRVMALVKEMQIGFASYEEFGDFLRAEDQGLGNDRNSDQTLHKLIDGMLAELADRELISG